jgi:hypothetical protein
MERELIYLCTGPYTRGWHFGIRHAVYVQQRAWETEARDGFDARSALFLSSAHAAGRVTFGPDLPIERVCHDLDLPDNRVEVGRLCALPVAPALEAVRVLRAMAQYLREQPVDYAVFLGRPAMGRLLNRNGIPCRQIGAAIEHHGKRIPFIVNVAMVQPLQYRSK